jgi:hypothetical protein
MALQGGQPQHVLGVRRGVGRRGRCRVSRCWLHWGCQGCREYRGGRGGRGADQELRRWGYCPRGLLGAGCPVLQGPGSSGRSVSSAGVLAGRLSACFRQRGGRQDERAMELYGHGAGHPANNGCCLGEDRRGAAAAGPPWRLLPRGAPRGHGCQRGEGVQRGRVRAARAKEGPWEQNRGRQRGRPVRRRRRRLPRGATPRQAAQKAEVRARQSRNGHAGCFPSDGPPRGDGALAYARFRPPSMAPRRNRVS